MWRGNHSSALRAFDQGRECLICKKECVPRPTNKKGRQRFLRRLIPYGGKESVKENRQGCLSRLIRAGSV